MLSLRMRIRQSSSRGSRCVLCALCIIANTNKFIVRQQKRHSNFSIHLHIYFILSGAIIYFFCITEIAARMHASDKCIDKRSNVIVTNSS